MRPLLGEGTVAGGVGLGSVRLAGRLSVDSDVEPDRGSWGGWRHDEVEVAGVEAAGDLPARRVRGGGLFGHGPLPGQGPLFESQPGRAGVGVRRAWHRAARRCEAALAQLPIHLAALGIARTWIGDFAAAASANTEAETVAAATGSRIAPYAALRLRCLQGK
jgi:hypothetical protein